MIDDFEDGEEFDIDDWEPTPEEIASIERAIQDCNDGFTYEMLRDEGDGKWNFKCNKCGRVAELHQRPFPHKYDCPMRRFDKDKD